MAASRRRGRTIRLQPPMTPMIDCVFQLLVFFMLMPNALAGEAYLTTNLPCWSGSRGPADVMPECVRIDLRDVGPRGRGVAIILNGYQSFGSNFEGLCDALRDLRQRGLSPECPVLISPTGATRHAWVVRAFDAAVAARYSHVCFDVPYE